MPSFLCKLMYLPKRIVTHNDEPGYNQSLEGAIEIPSIYPSCLPATEDLLVFRTWLCPPKMSCT